MRKCVRCVCVCGGGGVLSFFGRIIMFVWGDGERSGCETCSQKGVVFRHSP